MNFKIIISILLLSGLFILAFDIGKEFWIIRNNLTPESAVNNILSLIKSNKIHDIKFAHCGESPYFERDGLDKGLDKYWSRIQQYDWSNAIVSSQSKFIGDVYFDNIVDQNKAIRKEKIILAKQCNSLRRYPFLLDYYGFTPDY